MEILGSILNGYFEQFWQKIVDFLTFRPPKNGEKKTSVPWNSEPAPFGLLMDKISIAHKRKSVAANLM